MNSTYLSLLNHFSFSPKSTSNRTHKEKLFTAHRLSAGGSASSPAAGAAPSPAAGPEAFPRRTDWSITMSGINVPAVRVRRERVKADQLDS